MEFVKRNLYLILGGLLIAGAIYVVVNNPDNTKPTTTPLVSEQPASFRLQQKINYGGLKPDENQSVEVTAGETAFDLVRRTKNTEIKEYDFGKLIDSIEGIKNGTDTRYWLYYINDQAATVGADQYVIKQNDKIEWKFEKEIK